VGCRGRRSVRLRRWPTARSAPDCVSERRTFRVTHPFHPLYGRKFALVTCRHDWGEDRVYYHDDEGKLSSLPSAWTTVSAVDPFVVLAAERSPFRLPDLLELCRLLEAMGDRQGDRTHSEEERRV